MHPDFRAAATLARSVVELAPQTPEREHWLFLATFPRESCGPVSYVIAQLLLEGGLGDWWVVTHIDAQSNGHVWLEWRDETGAVLFTIDATADQFPTAEHPYIEAGVTPSRSRFAHPQKVSRFSDLNPDAGWEDAPTLALMAHVRAAMASR